jgi:hypothetical protein
METAAGEIIVALASAFVCFQMGREWQRVFGKPKVVDSCPFGAQCLYCHPTASASATVHMMMQPNSGRAMG